MGLVCVVEVPRCTVSSLIQIYRTALLQLKIQHLFSGAIKKVFHRKSSKDTWEIKSQRCRVNI